MSALSKHQRGIGYMMQAREFTSAAEMLAARAELNQRLFKLEPKPAPAVLCLPSPEPSPPIVVLDYVPLNMLSPPSWKFLVAFAAARRGVPADEVMGHSRGHIICQARHDAVALIAAYCPERTPLQIGRLFGRDRATIVHSIRLRQDCLLPPIDVPSETEKPVPAKPKAVAKATGPRRARKPAARKPTVLQNAVKRAYAFAVPLRDVAEEYGSTTGSLKVIAHNMGLRRPKSKYGEPAPL